MAKVNITEEEDREKIVKEHFTQIKLLIEQKTPIFYTDESELNLTSRLADESGQAGFMTSDLTYRFSTPTDSVFYN